MYKLLILYVLISTHILAQERTFINPIINGGYPDPSICRVGNDYYIVNSSFEYFPGLPIHHSKDLINWELVSYGLHREDQCNGEVNLVDVNSNGGIHAPTIRYHKGIFYIITTNVYYNPEDIAQPTKFVNFIITAKNIKGPWSDPHILDGAPGIDPDIFFDDDGKVWYVGTHSPEKPNFEGEGEIWLQEIDLDNWKLKGERNYLWRGACGGVWVEGPHMYKRDGRYYLLVAEGGTSFNHAVMIAVSDDIKGPYTSNPRNPILSSRQLSYDHWVNSTGHADMVELPDGRWYMVALGIRGDQERKSNMGRETFLVPMQWEREPFEWNKVKYEWPVCAPLTGRVERVNPLPFDNTIQNRNHTYLDNFDAESLNMEWNFRRVPMTNTYSLSAKEGYLRLYAKPNVIKERGRTSLMGIRQTESDFEFSSQMLFTPKNENVEAGIILFQKDDNFISYTIIKNNQKYVLKIVLAEHENDPIVLEQKAINGFSGKITFRVLSRNYRYHFEYSLDESEKFIPFIETDVNHILSRGYTGAYMGVYATSNGEPTYDYADFDWVEYKGYQRF
jgi:alpha-N-arabinofuranosidase